LPKLRELVQARVVDQDLKTVDKLMKQVRSQKASHLRAYCSL
jgi:hypothetical protein